MYDLHMSTARLAAVTLVGLALTASIAIAQERYDRLNIYGWVQVGNAQIALYLPQSSGSPLSCPAGFGAARMQDEQGLLPRCWRHGAGNRIEIYAPFLVDAVSKGEKGIEPDVVIPRASVRLAPKTKLRPAT
jgi:hypothetical protein